MTTLMNTRDGVKIFLDADEKRSADVLRETFGMTQKEMSTRLFRWFLGQDDVTQRAVLGLLPDSVAPDVAKAMLERMAEKPRPRIAANKARGARK